MNEFTDQALERLKKEYGSVKGAKAGAMKKAVREALESNAEEMLERARAQG